MSGSVQQIMQVPLDYKRMAEIDGLTDIYNRRAVEYRINQRLRSGQGGTLFVLDMDSFKKINDQFGHTVGDQVLKSVANILTKMFPESDMCRRLVGRIGGDEFVVFLPENLNACEISACILQIRNRFQKLRISSSLFFKISMTVSGAASKQNDNFVQLFDRADQILIQKKAQKNIGMQYEQISRGVKTDADRIFSEMRENSLNQGAFGLDYETFKSIFRYEERKMLRSNELVNMILITLADQSGDFPSLEHRDHQMCLLSEIIQQALRMGDLYTQYTSCQFLVMVAQASEIDTEAIAQRIRTRFYDLRGDAEQDVILHHCYPLKPAGKA
ncbi:MAG: GGDEF domain-containing protein [Oscillospiraceae bacterium]